MPIWHEMDQALEAALKATAKKHKAFVSAQGNCYSEFTRKHQENVQEVLLRVSEAVKKVDEIIKQGDDVLPKVRSDLVQLKPLNDDIKAKRKAAKTLKEKADKSAAKVASCQKKLETLRMKNPSSPDCNRAENEYDLAVRTKESDEATSEQRQEQLLGEEKEYKKQFFLCILSALEEYAQARQSACNEVIASAKEVAQIGESIPFYDDPQIEGLQSQLQALRSETPE